MKTHILFCNLAALSASWSAAESLPSSPLAAIISHQQQHSSGDVLCSFDRSIYDTDTKALPIGVFDSGIGGLTVLDAILGLDVFKNDTLQPGADGVRDFTHERFIYLGDQANMPYGNYAAAGRADLLKELILRDAIFLLSNKQKEPVKALVIACNTATAFGLEDIRAALDAWGIKLPVIGVVEAGARGLSETLPREGRADAVAVFATVGTCACEAYPKTIGRVLGLMGKPIPTILQQGCIGLAGAIEGDPAFLAATDTPYLGPQPPTAMQQKYGFGQKLNSVKEHVRYEVTSLMERHRASGETSPIGFVMLGCTHFPLVVAEFKEAFATLRSYTTESGEHPYAALIRESITFINPAEFTAKELFKELARAQIRLKESTSQAHQLFISVPEPTWPGIKLTASGGLDSTYKTQRKLADFTRADTRVIPMTASLLPQPSAKAIEKLMPQVWNILPSGH